MTIKRPEITVSGMHVTPKSNHKRLIDKRLGKTKYRTLV